MLKFPKGVESLDVYVFESGLETMGVPFNYWLGHFQASCCYVSPSLYHVAVTTHSENKGPKMRAYFVALYVGKTLIFNSVCDLLPRLFVFWVLQVFFSIQAFNLPMGYQSTLGLDKSVQHLNPDKTRCSDDDVNDDDGATANEVYQRCLLNEILANIEEEEGCDKTIL